jgi:hypothetical protein
VLRAAQALIAEGLNDCEIGRRLGIPRGTIRDWRHGKIPKYAGEGRLGGVGDCPVCDGADLDRAWYAYLLGMYLGDGCISPTRRCVYNLRVALDISYINIIDECAEAIRRMRPNGSGRVGFVHPMGGLVVVNATWKHWPCLFPQHAPGLKYKREIALEPWQEWIVLQHPRRLLRGLIHSDGCRDKNVVKGKSYPRYSFCNNSEGIRQIFCNACDLLGVHRTKPRWNVIAISRRADVATLDRFIGPKT